MIPDEGVDFDLTDSATSIRITRDGEWLTLHQATDPDEVDEDWWPTEVSISFRVYEYDHVIGLITAAEHDFWEEK